MKYLSEFNYEIGNKRSFVSFVVIKEDKTRTRIEPQIPRD